VESAVAPWLISALSRETGRKVLVIAKDDAQAVDWFELLSHLEGQQSEFGRLGLLSCPHLSAYIEVSVDHHRQIAGLGTLTRLALGELSILVVTAAALSGVQPSPGALAEATRFLSVGQEESREELLDWLLNSGYSRVTSVMEPGTFSVRGSLLDVFSPGTPSPLRVDFFGDEIESIGVFDVDSQRSCRKVDRGMISVATPVIHRERALRRARPHLLELAGRMKIPSSRFSMFMEQLRDQDLPLGVEAVYPLLVETCESVLDYLDPSQWSVVVGDMAEIEAQTLSHFGEQAERYVRALEEGKLALEVRRLYLPGDRIEERLRSYPTVNLGPLDPGANYRATLVMTEPFPTGNSKENRWDHFLSRTRHFAEMGVQCVVVGSDSKDASQWASRLMESGLPCRIEPQVPSWQNLAVFGETVVPFRGGGGRGGSGSTVRVMVGDLPAGVDAVDLSLWLVTTGELAHRRAGSSRAVTDSAAHREFLLTLQEGDHVVHMDYGIGRYLGVERKLLGGGEYTCLKMEYAGGDQVYVPVHNAGRIQRYVGSGQGNPRLDRLGGAVWRTKVEKARKATKKLAVDLLKLYARRKAMEGHSYSPGDDYFQEFQASFPYQETPDQQRAIDDVLADMEQPSPMDRLVCGDVGFGKTEVAVRAAFKAVMDGRQVAVLVPTTVLAEQHRTTFAERLKGYPVLVESLSRFKSSAQQKEVLRSLESGKVDIVIGTHRLLGKDIQFRALGLIIVDEEHRFGVGHKEQLKELRATVDVLSLTATPIPRTLHMAMSGIRDLSVIKSPPPGRRDIETSLISFDSSLIRQAIQRELDREGQLFFLHNRVDDLGQMKEQLESLVPGLRVVLAHGQMDEKQLERAMVEFIDYRHDVLLCTTIIESGLDIGRVNTLIVNNAHHFGLAQLYQIRGRIGRSNRQAYAYFVVPPVSAMTGEARSRLAALARFSSVGSGFQIASIDMELRGVGDLLGPNQSGHVAAVGFDMYMHLLHEAVEDLKEATPVRRRDDCQVEIPVLASIPEEYVTSEHQRLVFYRMIGTASSMERLEEYRQELQDRFGPIPEPVEALLKVASLRLRGQAMGLSKLVVTESSTQAKPEFSSDAILRALLRLVREQPVEVKATADGRLVFSYNPLLRQLPLLDRAEHLLSIMENAASPEP
jgi:transcription-repair coupling factor (superfamily II helicase)